MPPGVILNILFIFCVAALSLSSIYRYIIFPACAIPWLRRSQFCSAVGASYAVCPTPPPVLDGTSTTGSWANFITMEICKLPPLSYMSVCVNGVAPILAGAPFEAISTGLESQYLAYHQLMAGTAVAPGLGRDIREIVLSIDDLAILLKGKSFKNKDSILSQLNHIRITSRESARRLQKYTAKLLSSVSLILTSSEYTIEVAEHSAASDDAHSLSKHWNLWISANARTRRIREAFQHTIKTFESLNRDLTHLNGETHDALTILDGYMEVLTDLIYDEALVEAKKDLGDILGRFWTMLGGHRSLLNGAKERVETLKTVGRGTQTMRVFVLEVQLQLERLQTGVDELRAMAAEPLLVGSPIPFSKVIKSLKDGCTLLKSQVWHPALPSRLESA